MRMSVLRVGRLVTAALIVYLAMGQGPAAADAIKIGDIGIIADAPFYIAIEKKFFSDAGLDVALQSFSSAAAATAPLSTNQIQVAGGGMSAGIFNAFARGWPVRIGLARTRDMPGHSGDSLLIRKDLQPQVRTLADLKGRTIALNAPFGALHYMLAKMLESEGLGIGDVKVVSMPLPNMGAALDTKAVEGATVSEPFGAKYDGDNLSFTLKRAADVMKDPPLEVSVLLYSKDWMDAHPDQAQAFTTSYLRAVRTYVDAMNGGSSRPEVVRIIMKYTHASDPAVYDRIQWSYMDPNGEISKPSLRDQQDWYRKVGAVKEPVDIDSMIDSRFLNKALAELGRVNP